MLIEQAVVPILHLHIIWDSIGVWHLAKKFQHCKMYTVMMWTLDFS